MNRLALRGAQRGKGGGGGAFGGGTGFPGFVSPMQGDCSQNANDVHVEVHRPGKERRTRRELGATLEGLFNSCRPRNN